MASCDQEKNWFQEKKIKIGSKDMPKNTIENLGENPLNVPDPVTDSKSMHGMSLVVWSDKTSDNDDELDDWRWYQDGREAGKR